MELFSFPAVYDTAFQFRNARKAVDFIEWCSRAYAEIPIRSVVDIACGTGHYTREFARRKYRTYGVDLNPDICQYTQQRAQIESLAMTVINGDMVDFVLPEQCDLAVNFFDSLTYLADRPAIEQHFRTVAQVLAPGGLYILEVGVIDDFSNHTVEEVWTEIRRDFSVATIYRRDRRINPESQTFEEYCSFQAVFREHKACFLLKFIKCALSFKDLQRMITVTGAFTPVAYYENFDEKSLIRDDERPWRVIGVLKKN